MPRWFPAKKRHRCGFVEHRKDRMQFLGSVQRRSVSMQPSIYRGDMDPLRAGDLTLGQIEYPLGSLAILVCEFKTMLPVKFACRSIFLGGEKPTGQSLPSANGCSPRQIGQKCRLHGPANDSTAQQESIDFALLLIVTSDRNPD